jgi:hypothetical protein
MSLNLQIQDDTDIIFGKINRYKYDEIGKPIVDRGGTGKVLYAFKGKMIGGFSFGMIMVEVVRFLGTMDDDAPPIFPGSQQGGDETKETSDED